MIQKAKNGIYGRPKVNQRPNDNIQNQRSQQVNERQRKLKKTVTKLNKLYK
jgi:hypothetical protein